MLVGYGHAHAVSKHERSKSAPPLLVALGYQIALDIPVDRLFPGFRSAIAQVVEHNIEELKRDLATRDVRLSPEKAQWLTAHHLG